jgi:hypothetical protein
LATEPATGTSTSRIPALAAALKLPLALACIVAIVLATYYFFYVTDKRSYLVDRDFRLLATIGQELHEVIESDHQVIRNLLNSAEETRSRDKDNCGWDLKLRNVKQCVARFIPVLRTADVIKWPDKRPRQRHADVQLQVTDDGSSIWIDRRDANDVDAIVQIKLADLVVPFVDTAMVRSAFDSVFVAASDGRVLFRSVGLEPYITRLDKLTDLADPKKPQNVNFDAIGRTAGMVDVEAFGSVYTMFTQPCCAGLTAQDTQNAGEGLVLCALTQRKKVTSASYAVPFSIAFLTSVGLFLMLLGWPFLRLRFIGESDRVQAHDIVLIALSGLIGLGLIAILTLDVVATSRLRALLDGQLIAFGKEIESAAAAEIAAASEQFKVLDTVARAWLPDSVGTIFNNQGNWDKSYFFRDEQLQQYPWFESFAELDDTGQQQKKLSLGEFVTSLVNVSTRSYFTHWIPELGVTGDSRSSSGSNAQPGDSSTMFLESVRSITTGTRQAVLSRLSGAGPCEDCRGSLREDGRHVETLAIPMRSLINPVVPRGFSFVVVDSDGKVQFHSDPEHRLLEDFFVESDRSRRLRALAGARETEHVDITYWGSDQRAFVQPFAPSRLLADREWTLVTFFEDDLVRTVRMEWLVHALLFFVAYVGAYLVTCSAVLILAPGYRAPWMWPDPARSGTYLDLLPPLAFLAIAFTLAIATSAPGPLLIVGWLVPFLAWITVYIGILRERSQGRLTLATIGAVAITSALGAIALRNMPRLEGLAFVGLTVVAMVLLVLKLRRSTTRRSSPLPPPVSASYGFAAGLLLLLTALLPGVAFFKVGWDLQIRAFVKYGQLEIARHRVERDLQEEKSLAEQFSSEGRARIRQIRKTSRTASVGVYHAFFFDSDKGRLAESVERSPAQAPVAEQAEAALPELMEELLPFYSESSVRLRELVHDRTADESSRWTQRGANLFLYRPAAVTEPVIQSVVPSLVNMSNGGRPTVLLILATIAMAGALVWVARFLIDDIFLVDIIEPLTMTSVDVSPPRNTFRVTDRLPRLVGGHRFLVNMATVPEPAVDRMEWVAAQLTLLHVSPAMRGVLIVNFAYRLSDGAFSELKLVLLEHILLDISGTVEIYSTVPPSAFVESMRDGNGSDRASDPLLAQRWASVFARFTVVPAAAGAESTFGRLADAASWRWREWVWTLLALGFSHRARFLDAERGDPQVGSHWRDVLPYAWLPERPLNVSQLLVEVGDRAQKHYEEIWTNRTPSEQLVLGQLAQEGLINPKTRMTVRTLMAGGLIRRQPNFVLMNETFRQFVLAAFPRSEAAGREKASVSTWNTIRWPFFVLVVGSLAFLWSTQEQLFNSTLALITAVTAFVPAVLKLISTFSGRTTSE